MSTFSIKPLSSWSGSSTGPQCPPPSSTTATYSLPVVQIKNVCEYIHGDILLVQQYRSASDTMRHLCPDWPSVRVNGREGAEHNILITVALHGNEPCGMTAFNELLQV